MTRFRLFGRFLPQPDVVQAQLELSVEARSFTDDFRRDFVVKLPAELQQAEEPANESFLGPHFGCIAFK